MELLCNECILLNHQELRPLFQEHKKQHTDLLAWWFANVADINRLYSFDRGSDTIENIVMEILRGTNFSLPERKGIYPERLLKMIAFPIGTFLKLWQTVACIGNFCY